MRGIRNETVARWLRRLALLLVPPCMTSCGTFAANKSKPTFYGGTQLHTQVLAANVGGKALADRLNIKCDLAEDPDAGEYAVRGLSLGFSLVDLPLSAAADTLLLPWQTYFVCQGWLEGKPIGDCFTLQRRSEASPSQITLVRRVYREQPECSDLDALVIACDYLGGNDLSRCQVKGVSQYWFISGLRHTRGEPDQRGVYISKSNGDIYRGPTTPTPSD